MVLQDGLLAVVGRQDEGQIEAARLLQVLQLQLLLVQLVGVA